MEQCAKRIGYYRENIEGATKECSTAYDGIPISTPLTTFVCARMPQSFLQHERDGGRSKLANRLWESDRGSPLEAKVVAQVPAVAVKPLSYGTLSARLNSTAAYW